MPCMVRGPSVLPSLPGERASRRLLRLDRAPAASCPLPQLLSGLLELILRERQGEAVDRGLLKSLVRMLQSLGLYGELLEGQLLQASTEFYRAEAQQRMQVGGSSGSALLSSRAPVSSCRLALWHGPMARIRS